MNLLGARTRRDLVLIAAAHRHSHSSWSFAPWSSIHPGRLHVWKLPLELHHDSVKAGERQTFLLLLPFQALSRPPLLCHCHSRIAPLQKQRPKQKQGEDSTYWSHEQEVWWSSQHLPGHPESREKTRRLPGHLGWGLHPQEVPFELCLLCSYLPEHEVSLGQAGRAWGRWGRRRLVRSSRLCPLQKQNLQRCWVCRWKRSEPLWHWWLLVQGEVEQRLYAS